MIAPGLCICGRRLPNIGKLCPVCAEAKRVVRRAQPVKVPRRGVREPEPGRYPKHLEWIASLPCAVPDCLRRCVAAHVRMAGTGGGTALKPQDVWAAPLCSPFGHHEEQHSIGHRAFDAKYGVDLRALAQRLAALSPYLPRS